MQPNEKEGKKDEEEDPKVASPQTETERALKQPGTSPAINEESTAAKTTEKETEGGEHHHEHHHEHKHEVVSKRTAVILVLALGFHALFEGVAFGLMTEIS